MRESDFQFFSIVRESESEKTFCWVSVLSFGAVTKDIAKIVAQDIGVRKGGDPRYWREDGDLKSRDLKVIGERVETEVDRELFLNGCRKVKARALADGGVNLARLLRSLKYRDVVEEEDSESESETESETDLSSESETESE